MRIFATLLVLVGLALTIAPPRLLSSPKRWSIVFASFAVCFALILYDNSHSGPVRSAQPHSINEKNLSSTAETSQVKTSEASKARATGKVDTIRAIRLDKSLFIDVRKNENIYCVADYPFLVIGEQGGDFFAVNGTARQFANNEKLHVLRNGTWVPVYDRGVNPFQLEYPEATRPVRIGNELCPSSAVDVIENMRRGRIAGEHRMRELGAQYAN